MLFDGFDTSRYSSSFNQFFFIFILQEIGLVGPFNERDEDECIERDTEWLSICINDVLITRVSNYPALGNEGG